MRGRERDTDAGILGEGGGDGGWQHSLISGTWLYNWALIDTKSIAWAHDVSYTCCRPQAGCAGAISVPSPPDWCLSVKCPSAICTHNRSTSISVEHLLPSIHPSVISPFLLLSVALYLPGHRHIDSSLVWRGSPPLVPWSTSLRTVREQHLKCWGGPWGRGAKQISHDIGETGSFLFFFLK